MARVHHTLLEITLRLHSTLRVQNGERTRAISQCMSVQSQATT
jgi:hypothetical protein